MQRTNILMATVVGFSLLAMAASVAFAKEAESGGSGGSGGNGSDDVSIQLGVGATAQDDDNSNSGQSNDDIGHDANDDKGGLRGNASSSVRSDDDSNDDLSDDDSDDTSDDLDDDNDSDNDTSDDLNDDNGGNGEGEKHRSAIADVVLSLKALADRDGGIGEEIRTLAREQASSTEGAARAMAAVEARNAILTFLFGTDFKNIGVLRSELETTQNHIVQLSKAKTRVLDADVKAGIDVQIAALQKANADAEAFVQAHEENFSIFGWFVRMFQ